MKATLLHDVNDKANSPYPRIVFENNKLYLVLTGYITGTANSNIITTDTILT